MPSVYFFSGAIDDRKRRDLIFRGDLIIFKQLPKMKALCALADELLAEAFGELDPDTAHQHMDYNKYMRTIEPLQKCFTNHPRSRSLFHGAIAETGVDVEKTYCDWFPLRIQPNKGKHAASSTMGYAAHRDSWFSNTWEQTNWWAPIRPITPDRSMAFFPDYFDKPIPNNSKGWDLLEFRTARAGVRARGGSFEELMASYPYVSPTEPIDESSEVRFILEPGDILNFSTAHLHASVPNTSDAARFSTELRTIHIDDTLEGRGAPNVDSESTGNAYYDFFHMVDGSPIGDATEKAA